MKEYSGICVYAEYIEGKIAPSVFEIIYVARKLQMQNQTKVSAILTGDGVRKVAEVIISYGIEEVYVVDKPIISNFAEDVQADIIVKLLKLLKPEVFLGCGTTLGKSIFPRIAAALKTGLCADCIELNFNSKSGNLHMLRTTFGGDIIAEIAIPNHRPQMATVKPNVFPAAEVIEGFKGRITDVSEDYCVVPSVFEILRYMKIESKPANMDRAKIIVAAGLGIKKAENLSLIHAFANAVGGAVGASRAIVDAGWMDYSHQIGQTGKIVNPHIYIACGISGAIQHQIGIRNSKTIIAINIDRYAPIFDIAAYGIVGDLQEVIPDIINQLRS